MVGSCLRAGERQRLWVSFLPRRSVQRFYTVQLILYTRSHIGGVPSGTRSFDEEAPMPPHPYRVLFLGDSWAAARSTRGGRALSMLGVQSGEPAAALQPFTTAADKVVAATPVYRLPGLEGRRVDGAPGWLATGLRIRRYVGALQRAGVHAVSLASPAVMGSAVYNYGRLQQALSDAGIEIFGAGRTSGEAHQPHRILLPQVVGGGELHLHGSMAAPPPDPGSATDSADGRRPICAVVGEAHSPQIRPGPQDSFRVALPSWGGRTGWRKLVQFHSAEKLLDADYDLVLGHGPAAAQEVLRSQRRWVVHSMGARPSSAHGGGSMDSRGTSRFSFWTMLEVGFDHGVRIVRLKLYPIVSAAGREAARSPRPCGEFELATVVESLQGRSPNGWSFDNPSRGTGQDDLGWYIQLDLGPWSVGERPQRAPGLLEEGDPDEAQPFRTYASIRQGLERFSPDRHLGSSLNAEAAENAGAEIQWVTPKLALATTEERSYLIDGYMAHSSQVGAEACTDKYQTHKFLRSAGVPVTRAALVRSAEEAWKTAEQIGTPVVLKPADRDRARGVSVNLSTPDEVKAAYHQARHVSRRVMVGSTLILRPRCV